MDEKIFLDFEKKEPTAVEDGGSGDGEWEIRAILQKRTHRFSQFSQYKLIWKEGEHSERVDSGAVWDQVNGCVLLGTLV